MISQFAQILAVLQPWVPMVYLGGYSINEYRGRFGQDPTPLIGGR